MKGFAFKRLGTLLIKPVLKLAVTPSIQPEDLGTLNINPDLPVIYALKVRSHANLLVVDKACAELGLPRPLKGLTVNDWQHGDAYFFVSSPTSNLNRKSKNHSLPEVLVDATSALNANLNQDGALDDVQIVPVSVFWGRVPDKENSIFKLMFSDNWKVPGRFRKLLIILVQGRNTLVNFSAPLSLREAIDHAKSEEHAVRKISRLLRGHFKNIRETIVGPDLSHRNTIVSAVLDKTAVQNAIQFQAEDKLHDSNSDVRKLGKLRWKAYKEARSYAEEIAADYTHSVIRIYEVVLTWVWNKLYDGVEITGWKRLKSVATDNVVIYVPSHRSHIDYLLMSYALYTNKIVPPHIAAGVNLNLPVLGSILRRGGAFFLRRSFKGNPLYSAVFNEYLNEVFDRGFSVEYFIEGGRSRTGRMLQPRPGMLAMTVRSYLRLQRRKFVFVPIYFGYEKVIEGGTYVGELHGKTKKKESIFGVFKSIGKIKGTFGRVHVNFGEPIHLTDHLDAIHPNWQKEAYDDNNQPAWLHSAVDKLGRNIITHINDAAVVNPVSLFSQILLATNKLAMDERQLLRQLELYLELLRAVPYSNTVRITTMNAPEILDYCESIDLFERKPHPLGDILVVPEEKAVLLTYFRNNNLHLFAIPSLIACLLINNRRIEASALVKICQQVQPFLKSELFINRDANELPEYIDAILDVLEKNRLVSKKNAEYWSPQPSDKHHAALFTLAQAIRQTLERFYIAVDILQRTGSGVITREELENRCHLMAQRMSLLHGFSAPEFFDKALFRNFLQTLIHLQSIWENDDGLLEFNASLSYSHYESYQFLAPEIRESINQVTNLENIKPEATEPA